MPARRPVLVGSLVAALAAPALTVLGGTAATASTGPQIDQARAQRLVDRTHRGAVTTSSGPTTGAPRTAAALAAGQQPCVLGSVASLADRIVVSWAPFAGTPAASSYRVLRGPSYQGPWTLLATLSGSARQYADRAMPQSWDSASYVVQAVYSDGSVSATDCNVPGMRGEDAAFAASTSGPGLYQAGTLAPGAASALQTGGETYSPSYSPDGTRVTFAWAPDSTTPTSIWVRPADGQGAAVEVASATDATHDLDTPAWSPDGRSIVATDVATSSTGDVVGTHLVRIDARTKAKADVPGSTDLAVPSWLPNSVDVVAADLSSTTAPLVRLSTAKGTRATVPGTAGGDEPDVSPDGRAVLYTTWAGGTTDPVVLHRAPVLGGSAPTTVRTSAGDGYLWSPRWSPDSTRVLWLEIESDGSGYWRQAAPDGTNRSDLNVGGVDLAGIDSFDLRRTVDPGTSDFTGDGINDVLARDGYGVLWLYPGRESYTTPVRPLGTRIKVGSGWNGMTLIEAAGDLNGDGHPDLVARDKYGVLWLYPTVAALTGSSGWGSRQRYGSGWNAMTAVMGVGDWTGDGLADLLARNKLGELRLYTGDGFGGLLGGTRIGSGFSGWSLLEGVGDAGDDGHADFVARNTKGELWLFRGSGTATGRLLAARRLGTGWTTISALAGPERFVLGSSIDVLARDSYGRLLVYTSNGSRLQNSALVGSGWNALTEITS